MLHMFEIQSGELMSRIEEQAKTASVANGAIVSLIGAADTFTISTMPAADATADTVTDYELPAEMHGTGEIVDGRVHIHVTMAVEGDTGLSGHLHRALIGTHFARAYVIAL